ncbi:MAG: hypothetical protein IJ793_00690 [Opitutales bacterium]|nr:hypothetical protein [Opitutales bacterium]
MSSINGGSYVNLQQSESIRLTSTNSVRGGIEENEKPVTNLNERLKSTLDSIRLHNATIKQKQRIISQKSSDLFEKRNYRGIGGVIKRIGEAIQSLFGFSDEKILEKSVKKIREGTSFLNENFKTGVLNDLEKLKEEFPNENERGQATLSLLSNLKGLYNKIYDLRFQLIGNNESDGKAKCRILEDTFKEVRDYCLEHTEELGIRKYDIATRFNNLRIT